MKKLLLLLTLLITFSCTGNVYRVHIDDEPLSTLELSDVDLRAMVSKMAIAIIEIPEIRDSDDSVNISFLNIENRTDSPDFNSYLILSKIRKLLIQYSKRKLRFIDNRSKDPIYAERDYKRSGNVTSKDYQDMIGADFFLTGHAYSNRIIKNSVHVVYHRYSFRLTNAETKEVIWEDEYEVKKAGKRAIIYN